MPILSKHNFVEMTLGSDGIQNRYDVVAVWDCERTAWAKVVLRTKQNSAKQKREQMSKRGGVGAARGETKQCVTHGREFNRKENCAYQSTSATSARLRATAFTERINTAPIPVGTHHTQQVHAPERQ